MAPTVPTYEPGGRRRTNPYQPNQVNADMFGANVGRAIASVGENISSLGSTFAQLEKEQKAKNDTARVMEAYTDGTKRLREVLYDPENGLYNRTGRNAEGVLDLTSEEAQRIFSEVEGTLDNEDQKEAFRRMWQRKEESTLDGMSKYEFDQMGAATTQAKTSALANLEADIVANYNNPDALAANFDAVRGMIRANPDGLPQEAVEQLERESVSKLHLQVIQRMSLDNPALALEYYEDHKGQVSGSDHALAEKYISAVEQIRDARGIAEEISSGGGASDIINAMISAESSGDPSAVSSAGALGLMQLMPDTAREMAYALGLKDVSGMDDADLQLFFASPEGQEINKRLGTAYLSRQLTRFNGDVEAALVAYNAGPDNAVKWLNAGRDYSVLPKPEETYPYVGKVLGQAFGITDTQGGMEGASQRYQDALKGSGSNMFTGGSATDFLLERLQPGRPASYVTDMNPVMRDRLAAFMAAAPDFVKDGLDLLSGARSEERQKELWDAALAKYGSEAEARKWVAPPGKSQHNHGNAADLGWNGAGFSSAPQAVKDWVHQNAERFGLAFPLSNEGWHIETTEARGGQFQEGLGFSAGNVFDGRVFDGQGNMVEGQPGLVTLSAAPGSAANVYTQFASPYRTSTTGSLDAMLAEAEERYWDRPDLLAEVQRQIKNDWNTKQATQQAQVDSLKMEVFRGIMNGQKVRDFPPALLEQIGAEGVSSLLTLESKFEPGNSDKTDDRTYYQLTMMDPADFAEVDLLSYAEKLSATDFQKFADRQAELLRGGDGVGQVVGMRTRSQIMSDTVALLGLEPTKNQDDARSVATLERMLDDKVRAYAEANNGKSPGAPEIQEMVDRLILEGTIDGSGALGGLFGNDRKMVYQLTPDELNRFTVANTVNDIPAEDQAVVARAYRGIWGETPGEAGAVDFYNDMVRVSLGAAPTPPDALKTQILQALAQRLGRRPTEEEIANTYRRMIQSATGMTNGGR